MAFLLKTTLQLSFHNIQQAIETVVIILTLKSPSIPTILYTCSIHLSREEICCLSTLYPTSSPNQSVTAHSHCNNTCSTVSLYILHTGHNGDYNKYDKYITRVSFDESHYGKFNFKHSQLMPILFST